MRFDKQQEETQNFWISYADLMAGLLFVFILLVGAIVVRYVYVQQDLAQKREALGLSRNALMNQNRVLQTLREKLKKSQLALQQAHVKEETLQQSLSLSVAEVAKLKERLLSSQESEHNLTLHIAQVKEALQRTNVRLQEKEAYSQALEQNLSTLHATLLLKEDEIALLGKKLLAQSVLHQQLVEELNITKTKIKNLTGIRIKVVGKLKEKLGDSIEIDPKSGALRFASNILFNQGAYQLKPGAKKELGEILKKYIQTLLLDEEIRGYIESITIEGHTNTDGSYLYNLALSQKRALEVMKFLYESDPKNRVLYSRYLSASGRSYADLIYTQEGLEDKDASRRIEIKFRIKNEKAIKELERFLER